MNNINILNIEAGMKFYDERNGRYITVDSVDKASKTVSCTVTEYDEEENEITTNTLFNIGEIRHFEER